MDSSVSAQQEFNEIVQSFKEIEKVNAGTLPTAVLDEAAKIFSDNYGVWGPLAASHMHNSRLTKGRPIKMSSSFLRRQLIPSADYIGEARMIKNIYVRVTISGEVWGNMFATMWRFRGMAICWITQLVVKKNKRTIGVAKRMLNYVRLEYPMTGENCVVGILSPHPAAIRACYRTFRDSSNINLSGMDREFIRERARAIMGSCPVDYVRTASERLKGNCFMPEDEAVTDSDWCCANTEFYIDHEESNRVLNCLREWPYKRDLPDGHEYLALFPIGSILY